MSANNPPNVADIAAQMEKMKYEYTMLLNRFLAGSDMTVALFNENSQMRALLNEIHRRSQEVTGAEVVDFPKKGEGTE